MTEQGGPHQGWQPQGQSAPGWNPQGAPAPGQSPQYPQQPQQPAGGWQPGNATGGWQPGAPDAGWTPGPNPGPGPEQTGQFSTGGYALPTPPPKKRGLLITASAVVIALVAGVAIWFFAFRETEPERGQASPQAAAAALFQGINDGDILGLADTIDPVEANLIKDVSGQFVTEFKRLGLLDESATTENLTGVTVTMTGITFDDAAKEEILPNVTVVKLVSGTVTITSDPTKIPISQKLKDLVGEDLDKAMAEAKVDTKTFDIAKLLAENNDGEPFRIATVKRGDTWYPSLFYTIADNAVHEAGLTNPTAADAIPAVGGATPEAAIDAMINSVLDSNVEGVIAGMAPSEMGVLHDYGSLIVDAIDDETGGGSWYGSSELPTFDATWSVSDVPGGKKVSLGTLDVTYEGKTVAIVRDPAAGTLSVTFDGQTQVIDEKMIQNLLLNQAGMSDPRLADLVNRIFQKLIGLGVVTVQENGQWFVSPIRSGSDLYISVLQAFTPEDIDLIAELIKQGN